MKLKRCPFCGKKPKAERREDLSLPMLVSFIISCDYHLCDVKPRVTCYGKLETACKKWNRRAE